MEADVYAVSYEPRKGERIEGKLGIVIDTIKEHGIIFVPWFGIFITKEWSVFCFA